MNEPQTDEPRVSSNRVRNLSVTDLGITPPSPPGGGGAATGASIPSPPDAPKPLDPADPLLQTIQRLLQRFGGVIFVGPPGTSKTYFAQAAAVALAQNISRVRFVQFHPSYQYEDFVQGYVPNKSGSGFTLAAKHLLQMCEAAEGESTTYVIVIDELSRGDAARIFGEALTYVEKTKRNFLFSLASGDELSIPPNLVFLATMNPFDRGVDDVDAAFERRFAKIAMDPDPAICRLFLDDAGMATGLADRVISFFRWVNEEAASVTPQAALGHTFFLAIEDEADLRELWTHQLRFFFEKAFRLDQRGHAEVVTHWEQIFAATSGGAEGGGGGSTGGSAAPP